LKDSPEIILIGTKPKFLLSNQVLYIQEYVWYY